MVNQMTITLDEYARTIVKPMVIERIKAGRLDDVIADPDVWSIIAKDKDLIKATVERLEFLVANPPQSVFTEVTGNHEVAGDFILKTNLPNDYDSWLGHDLEG